MSEAASFDVDRLVFLDECSVNTAMTPRFARAPRGQRAVSHAPFRRGANISLLAAMNAKGVVAWSEYDGAVDGHRFATFLREKLFPKLKRGSVLVMDNLRVHKTDEVIDAVVAGGMRFCFIPPYHPELNAAEELFSLVKSALRRRKARTLDALAEATRDVVEGVRHQAAAFVRHALRLAATQPS